MASEIKINVSKPVAYIIVFCIVLSDQTGNVYI